jgi:Arc/MetJ-type ribon-helix-helix transcriptional regulator
LGRDNVTIHLPKDVERSIQAAVESGAYHSADDAVTAAWRSFSEGQNDRQADTVLTIDEIHRQLLADGLLSQLPDNSQDIDDDGDQPVAIDGEPLSETIIRDRR